jgi:hypothetical protein
MRSKLWQRLIGLALLAGCGLGTFYVWRVALSTHQFSRLAAGLFPFFGVFGLALLLSPLDFAHIRRELSVDETQFFRQLPVAWQLLTLVAVLAGLANWYAIVLVSTG